MARFFSPHVYVLDCLFFLCLSSVSLDIIPTCSIVYSGMEKYGERFVGFYEGEEGCFFFSLLFYNVSFFTLDIFEWYSPPMYM